MEDLNVKAIEMGNNNVESNVEILGNVEDLTKDFEQKKKTLERFIKSNRNETVITAQQKVVEAAKIKMEKAQDFERISKQRAVDSFFTFSVVDEETGTRTEQKKKIAFVKNNRPVNSKKVDGFIALIAANKYDKAFPIIVMEASKLIEAGYIVTDIYGRELSQEEAKDYFVILDGQHRSTAFAKLIATGNYKNLIPNVHVRDIENVGEYLVDINNVGSSWDKKDRLVVASLTAKSDLFQNVAELLKEGFNPTTAMLIYTGKNISDKQIANVLQGGDYTLPKGAEVNIERGNKFVTLCKAAKMDVSFITKRYFIKGFNSHALSTSEDQAFKALDNLKYKNYKEDKWKEVKSENDFIKILKEALEA